MKLTFLQVLAIRERKAAGELARDIAEDFGVTEKYVQCLAPSRFGDAPKIRRSL